MFACVCKAVRETEIHSARRCGMRSWEEVATICGAGTECGACQEHIDELLRSEGAFPLTRKPSTEQSAA